MIALNPQTQAFEYIGPPVFLDVSTGVEENGLDSIEKVISAAKTWLKRPSNDRLTLSTAFSSFDVQNYGDINKNEMENALSRIGIKLRPNEWEMLATSIES